MEVVKSREKAYPEQLRKNLREGDVPEAEGREHFTKEVRLKKIRTG